MYELNKLAPLKKKRKRVGRGGSRGGTSGKGHKGQKARSGGSVRPGFEGGQMPLYRRLPKRGFNGVQFETSVQIINLSRLDELFNDGETVTRELLIERGAIQSRKSKSPFLIKILGEGKLAKKLNVQVDRASDNAKKAIIDAGGSIVLIEEK